MVPIGVENMDWLKKAWVLIRYRNRIMKHIIIINNLKVQIKAEWNAIMVTVDLIKKESE